MAAMSTELTIVVDDSAAGAGEPCGLAVYVQGPGHSFLFDCGEQAEALAQNAAKFAVDLPAVEAVVLSHGHRDHTGGLEAMAGIREGLRLYAHQGAFSRRWADLPGRPLKDVSCPHSLEKLRRQGVRIQPVAAPEMIENWMILSGPVGGPPVCEGHYVVRKGDEIVVDLFEDEIFALLRGDRGWTILSGCCHRGLKNTLRCAKFLTRGEPIQAFIGGLHLDHATDAQLQQAVEAIEQSPQTVFYPCHCTGKEGIELLRSHFPSRVLTAGAGTRLTT